MGTQIVFWPRLEGFSGTAKRLIARRPGRPTWTRAKFKTHSSRASKPLGAPPLF